MNITKMLAEYTDRQAKCEKSSEIKLRACMHMTDTLACMVLGSGEDTPITVKNVLQKKKHFSTAEDKALYYGICAHVCDYDDLSINFCGHPGAVILPVVLALGKEKCVSGSRCLNAFITGTETAAVLGKTFSGTKMNKGWNPTTVLGIFGAVAAGAVLLEMPTDILKNAFGIAAGEASGLKVNYGSAAKDLTVGHCAAKAIFALKMAEAGLSAADDPLGAADGLFHILADDFSEERFKENLETKFSDFLDPGIIIKPYPACRGVHNGIDDALKLVKTYRIDPMLVKKITCRIQNTVFDSDRYPIPKNGAEGKFSLAYCIALALLNRKVVPDDFLEQRQISESELALIRKTECILDETFVEAKSGVDVEITMTDGTIYRVRGNYAKGDPRNPLTMKEFMEKLDSCLAGKISSDKKIKIIDWMDPKKIDLTDLEKMY